MVKQRHEIFDELSARPQFDVLVIGGGINGISVFRELALQGVRVLLVERNDFCSGASAASSHMAHGGIRYLENGEFRLVREAVQERNRLLRNAPHYVKPLATTIPIFKMASGLFNAPLKFLGLLDKPAERGAIVIKAGLMMYDAYTGDQGTVPRHEFTGRESSLAQFPAMNPKIQFTATYYDGSLDNPERIGLDVLLDGESEGEQAMALNYVSAVGADAKTIILRDETSGKLVGVQPKLVINAGGPWIDFINDALGTTTQFIGGTKGSHIVLDNRKLHDACNGNELFFENDDGRITLIYPFHGRVLVGTSDLRIDNPDDVTCTDEEIGYFLRLIKVVFPSIDVSTDQIVYQFSGVRPLPYQDANTTGQISRDHTNRIIEPAEKQFAIYNLIGGKWTTFRAFGAHVAEDALDYLGKWRQVWTEHRAFGGGIGYPVPSERQTWIDQIATDTNNSAEQVALWFDRYGTRAQAIADYASHADQPLITLSDYTEREIRYIVTHEKVIHLLDLVQRRTLLAMRGRLSRLILDEIALIMQSALGWSNAEREREVDDAVQTLTAEHGMTLL